VQAALVADGDIPGFYAMDAAMHELILSFTGFSHLAQVAETAWAHVNRARQLILPVPGRIQATLANTRRSWRRLRRAIRWRPGRRCAATCAS
jgi:GntR family transcriptional regulator, rspAB operon transcriptional repressor